MDTDRVNREALVRAETSGIIFIDEIDKIASREGGGKGGGPDVSREGVQRDILPIVEGSTVNTKYGQVKTDHMLFIAAGAFHVSKPSDLIPELQGRFPIRVELEPLSGEDLVRILREPRNSLIRQYTALLATEGVRLDFSDDAILELARIAQSVNERTENIGARRLHTVLERLLDEVSFNASEQGTEGPADRRRLRARAPRRRGPGRGPVALHPLVTREPTCLSPRLCEPPRPTPPPRRPPPLATTSSGWRRPRPTCCRTTSSSPSCWSAGWARASGTRMGASTWTCSAASPRARSATATRRWSPR